MMRGKAKREAEARRKAEAAERYRVLGSSLEPTDPATRPRLKKAKPSKVKRTWWGGRRWSTDALDHRLPGSFESGKRR